MNSVGKHVIIAAMALLATGAARAYEFGTIPDKFTGAYAGAHTIDGNEHPLHAIVIPYGDYYEVTLRDGPSPRRPATVVFEARGKDVITAGTTLTTESFRDTQQAGDQPPAVFWKMACDGKTVMGESRGSKDGSFFLKRVPFEPSPTLGAAPPEGALVLFDGTGLDQWRSLRGGEARWRVIPDEKAFQVMPSRKNIVTARAFGPYRLHLEFQLHYSPGARGQKRSNSGVYHLGRYETQVLDSYGLYGRDNECGGLYKVAEPRVNAVYPPGLWQTFDVEVVPPAFEDGRKVKNARITARLNGVLIHDDVEVDRVTKGGVPGPEKPTGPILLQDHGNPVKYRNLWIVED